MVKESSCTLRDFHYALRARDPLGVGFDSSADTLLHLIWKLLEWDPSKRISPADALSHPFFSHSNDDMGNAPVAGAHNAIESQMLDPRMDFHLNDIITDFRCVSDQNGAAVDVPTKSDLFPFQT
jgi:serine/threonine protein kinase